MTYKNSIWVNKRLEVSLNSKGKADHTIVQSLCVSVKTNYLMSHLQLATTRQLGLYSRAGDVFSSGIYSPHCCPARKTSPQPPPKLNKENGSVRSEASLPWKELSVENVSGKKKKANSLNRSRHIFQLNCDSIEKKTFFESHQAWCSSCKYNMTLTVNEFNGVK